MKNLEYTLATLPSLNLGGPAPFADMAAFWNYLNHLPEEWRADFTSAEAADPTVRAYRSWDLALRAALARLRLEGLPWKDQAAALPALGHELTQKALEILELSPLEGARALDQLRWTYLDDLEQGHVFDRVAFFVYALRLEIVLKQARLVREKGEQAFQTLHKEVLARTNFSKLMGEQS